MRVLIIAAGDGSRWGDFLGVPKHLAPILGEPILHRSVRVINEVAPQADVRVIVRDLTDPRYKVAGAKRAQAKLDPSNHDADKFLSSRYLWAKNDRTVILYGDLYLTTNAARVICSSEPIADDWRVYCRFDASTITGARGGENFAHVIDPPAHDRYEQSLHRIVGLRSAGILKRNGGWEQYRSLSGAADDELVHHRQYGNVTVIDDFTEDFDGPRDWDEWCLHYAQAPDELKALAR